MLFFSETADDEMELNLNLDPGLEKLLEWIICFN